MTFLVEKRDPHAVHPHLTDEERECCSPFEAAVHFEDFTGLNPLETVAELVREGAVRHVDPETGVEVVARRLPVSEAVA